MKRFMSLLTLLVFLSVMLAACGGGQTTTTPTEAPTEEMAEPTEEMAEPTEEMAEETPEAEVTPEAEETTEASGAFEGTIKIASQSPLSGPQAAIGVGIRNAAELGVEQLADPLTEMGFDVELVPFDDKAQPEDGTANANSIVSDQDILCVDGHLNSGVALAALPTYASDDVVMVSPANTNPAITEDFENAFRVVGRDDLQGPIGARFAADELGVTSVYIIHDQTDYGQGVASFFQQEIETLGVEVLGFVGVPGTEQVFQSVLTPILALNPDLIYFGGIYSQAGLLFDQARQAGIEAQFMGPDGLDNAELVDLGGDAVAGMYYTSVAAPVSQFPNAAQFAEDYQAAYNETAPPFSAQSYDSVGICIQAIVAAAEEAGGKPTRTQVLEAMRSLEPYEGITGTYSFDSDGDPDPGTYYVLQVNIEDWNQNAVASRLESSPPAEEGEGGSEDGDTMEATPEDAADEATPEDAADEATPEDAADEATPEDAADEATPEDGADEATPEDGADEATPEDGADEATPEE